MSNNKKRKQLSQSLANYQKIDWENIHKQEHPVQKRPLSSRKKYAKPDVLPATLRGYKKKKWNPKTKQVIKNPSVTLLNIKPKAEWTFQEWEKTLSREFIGKLTRDQLQMKYRQFQSDQRAVGKIKSVETKEKHWKSSRTKVNNIKTTYHVKTVKDKAKVMQHLAQSGTKEKIARSRYHDSMEEVMWAGKKIQLRKWHQSVELQHNSVVFAMDPQVGFRNESVKYSRGRKAKKKSHDVPRLQSVRMADDGPDMSIPDFILSSVMTPADEFESDNKAVDDAPIADQDIVIAMANPPPPSLLKQFLESWTVDLAFGIESQEAVRGEEKYGVFHHIIAMFCVDQGVSPPMAVDTDKVNRLLQEALHKRFNIDSRGGVTKGEFRQLASVISDVDEVSLTRELKKLMPAAEDPITALQEFASGRTTDLTYKDFFRAEDGEVYPDSLSSMIHDLVSKFDAYTSGIYPDEHETFNTTRLLVERFCELYVEGPDDELTRENFRKLHTCIDPVEEPELYKAFEADCQTMTLRAAEFHDLNLNENYVENTNASNFTTFLGSSLTSICFNEFDVHNEGMLPAFQLGELAHNLTVMYSRQIGAEAPSEQDTELFQEQLDNRYRDLHPSDILKLEEIDDISKCVLEMNDGVFTPIFKRNVSSAQFATFLRAHPLEVAKGSKVGSSTPADVFHDVVSMYNVSQGGCRLFPDETVNTREFLIELAEVQDNITDTHLARILKKLPLVEKDLEVALREDMMELISVPTHRMQDRPSVTAQLQNWDSSSTIVDSAKAIRKKRQQSIGQLLNSVFSDDEGDLVDLMQLDSSAFAVIPSTPRKTRIEKIDDSIKSEPELKGDEEDEKNPLILNSVASDSSQYAYEKRMTTIAEEDGFIGSSQSDLGVTQKKIISRRSAQSEPIVEEDESKYYVLNDEENPPLIPKPQEPGFNWRELPTKRNITCCMSIVAILVIIVIVAVELTSNTR